MLSEGWDARTVTHIMGLRAFTSQLLCEQVVGRGLRRTSYEVNPDTKLFDPEYVNIFGVPFTFLPHESKDGPPPPPPSPKTRIEPDKGKAQYEIVWPNIVRINHAYTPRLTLNMSRVVQHLWEVIRNENTDRLEPVFDTDRPIRSTGDMPVWYSGRPCEPTKKSHINFCVLDSGWEASEAFELDRNPNVQAWV